MHEALPYLGKKLDDELWRDWVLPYRVLEDDLELWRKDFYEQMQPVVQGKKTTKEVATAIHAWLWEKQADGEFRVKWGPVENRTKRLSHILKSRTGGCAELTMLYVAFLRSVGIPARV